jgi:RNA polymerase sigma-32 factor
MANASEQAGDLGLRRSSALTNIRAPMSQERQPKNASSAPSPPSSAADDDVDSDALAAELVEEASAGDESFDARTSIVLPRRSSGSSLTRYDPVQAYMRDVQRYPLLTPTEEHETAVRYHTGGDLEAAARLVTANLRLVVKIAYGYRRAHKNIMDLIQEGNIGLMQAVKKYDPYRGVKLSTYSAWWIRAYILRFILNNERLVKLGTTQAQRKLFFNLGKEKAKLAAMGVEATPELIAERLNVATDEVIQMDRRLASGDASLDAPANRNENDSVSRLDLLPSDGRRVDDALAQEEIDGILSEKLDEFSSTLVGKEAKIFHERLVSDEPRTLQELGNEFGVSRERVRQLEKRLQDKLRVYLTERLGPDVIDA